MKILKNVLKNELNAGCIPVRKNIIFMQQEILLMLLKIIHRVFLCIFYCIF